MAKWVRVQFVGDGPITMMGATWYPGEVHTAPAATIEQVEVERGGGLFVRLDVALETANAAAPVTEVSSEKKRSRK